MNVLVVSIMVAQTVWVTFVVKLSNIVVASEGVGVEMGLGMY